MYVSDTGQQDWDDYAERLIFALNTSHDRTRNETPFYLVHGWDPKTTVEAMIDAGSEDASDSDPRRWRFRIQRQYRYARKQVCDLIQDAQQMRLEAANGRATDHEIQAGSQVWVFIEKVKVGFASKLAHRWHGPFRVARMVNAFTCELETRGSGYTIFPLVHVGRLKLVRDFPLRPEVDLTVDPEDRLDFDEELLPEDSFEPDPEEGIYEVEQILDRKVMRPRTRNARHYVMYKVKWKGYQDPTWVKEEDLNCGGLIYDFNERQKSRNRFQVMQSHEESLVEEAAQADPGQADSERRM